MIWTFNDEKNRIVNIIKKIENEQVGLKVIAYDSWYLPLVKQKVVYNLTYLRKINILEEFIFNAILLNIPSGVNVPLISNLMGLDSIFIQDCVNKLCSKHLIIEDKKQKIRMTKGGEYYFEKGMIPNTTVSEEIEFYFDRKFGEFYTKIVQEDNIGVYSEYDLINKLIENKTKYINRQFILDVAKEQGNQIEDIESSKYITKIKSASTIEKSQTLMSEIWVYNTVTGCVLCKVWDHAKTLFRADIEEFINKNSIIKKLEVEKRVNVQN